MGTHRGGTSRAPRAHPWRRRVLIGLGVLLLLLVAAAGWLAHLGLQAKNDLQAAKSDLSIARAALVSGDTSTADRAVAGAQANAAHAYANTRSPLWRAAGFVPWAGTSMRTAASLADAVHTMAQDVLPGLVAVRDELDPAKLRPVGGKIDVAALTAAAPTLAQLVSRTAAVESQVAVLPTSGMPSVLSRAVTELQSLLGQTRSTLDEAWLGARLLSPMLGADGPRTYLVVFQNNAEARGTGGLIGAYAVISASKGAVTVERLGSVADLASLTAPALNLGPDYQALYGSDPGLWVNVNMSPHFPYAAQLMAAMWQRQFGTSLDGVIATDPVALSYLLKATGPVKLADGSQVTADSAVALTMKDVYARWPLETQNAPRDAYLQSVAKAVFDALLSGSGQPRSLLTELGAAVGARRLLVYSAHPAEEALLAQTPLAGALDGAPGPYAALVVNNAGGNKLDYYLGRKLSYALGSCTTLGRTSVVTATLTNGAPASGLPLYARLRLDRGSFSSGAARSGDGSTLEIVQVYAAVGAELTSATLDGAPVSVEPGTERGRPVYVVQVGIAPGKSAVLKLNLLEPASTVAPRAWVQPLVQPATVVVSPGPGCS